MLLAFSDPVALILIVLGLVGGVAAVVWTSVKGRRINETVSRLAYAALDGRPEEARVQARQGGSALAPVLEALSGELVAPRSRPWLSDIAAIVLLHLPMLVLLAQSALTLKAAEPAARLVAAASLFVGLAILWPLALTCSVIVVVIARRTERAVRGTCVSLIAKSVKTTVDAELAEALRRGAVYDPRGE